MAENTINLMNGQLTELIKNFKAKYSLTNNGLAKLLHVHKSTIGRWISKGDDFVAQLAIERLEQLIACSEVHHIPSECQKRAIYAVRIPLLAMNVRVCKSCFTDMLADGCIDEELPDGKQIWFSKALHRIEVSKLCSN